MMATRIGDVKDIALFTDRTSFRLMMTSPRSYRATKAREAMRQYVRSGERDVQNLLSYARELGVEKKVRNYLEVPL